MDLVFIVMTHTSGVSPTRTRPGEVEVAFRIWIACIAVSTVGGVASSLTTDKAAVVDQLKRRSAGRDVDPALIHMAGFFATASAVLTLVFAAVWALFAFKMRAGRNWARTVLGVLGVLDVIGLVLGLVTAGHTMPWSLFSITEAVLVIAALVVTFRPATRPYFTSPS